MDADARHARTALQRVHDALELEHQRAVGAIANPRRQRMVGGLEQLGGLFGEDGRDIRIEIAVVVLFFDRRRRCLRGNRLVRAVEPRLAVQAAQPPAAPVRSSTRPRTADFDCSGQRNFGHFCGRRYLERFVQQCRRDFDGASRIDRRCFQLRFRGPQQRAANCFCFVAIHGRRSIHRQHWRFVLSGPRGRFDDDVARVVGQRLIHLQQRVTADVDLAHFVDHDADVVGQFFAEVAGGFQHDRFRVRSSPAVSSRSSALASSFAAAAARCGGKFS